MSSPFLFQQSSSRGASWPDDMDRLIDDLYGENLFDRNDLMKVQEFYRCIANEPSHDIFKLICACGEWNPIFGPGAVPNWSAAIQNVIAYLHGNRSSGLQTIKLAIPDDLTRLENDGLGARTSRLFKRYLGPVHSKDRIHCNMHKWILMILLWKEWGLTISDCKVLYTEIWKKPPVPPDWQYLRPPEIASAAYLRRSLRLLSAKWDLPTTQQDGQQSERQGLFGKRNIFRLFYINSFIATEPEMHALDLIFFQEAECIGVKKVLLLSQSISCPLYVEYMYDSKDGMLASNFDYGNSDAPWSSQLLRQLITIVSNMRRHRRDLLEYLPNQFESFSNLECAKISMRCQLAELSDIKTRLHTGNMCCAANDQTISHLVDQLDTTPGLAVSEIDQEAVSELRSMLQDMKHFRTSLEQMEVEFQELRERVRDQLSMKQSLMITLLYTVMGVAVSLFLLSMPIGDSVARLSGAKDMPAASKEELPTIATLLSVVLNNLSSSSYPRVHDVLDILKVCLPGVVFALFFLATLEGRPLRLLYWFSRPDYHFFPVS